MDEQDKKPSWRDKMGPTADNGKLPKLADQFGEPEVGRQETNPPAPAPQAGLPPPAPPRPRGGALPPPPPPPAARKPEPAAEVAALEPDVIKKEPAAAESFAERLRARREAAERAGKAPGDSLGGGLHLRPAQVEPTEESVVASAPPPPTLRPAVEPTAPEPEERPRKTGIFGKSKDPEPTPAPEDMGSSILPPPSPVAPPAPIAPAPIAPAPVAAPPVASAPVLEPAPATPPLASHSEYDYSARARAAAEAPAPAPVAPAPLAPAQMAPPPAPVAAGGYQPGPAEGYVGAAGSAIAGSQPGYAEPPQSYAPPQAPQAGAYQAGAQSGEDYRYSDQRYTAPAPEYRSAHARELDYGDDEYAPAYAGRAAASDYEDAYNDYDDGYVDEPRRSRGPLFLFLGLAAIGLIAGGLIYWFTQNQSGTMTGKAPPVVSPQKEQVKVASPTPTTPQSPQQTKLFYDRIVGEETVEAERIVPREEQPLDPAQGTQQAAPQPAPQPVPQPAASQPTQNTGQPVPLKPLSPSDLVPGELPVPLPPPLPGQSGALQPGDPLSQTQQVASAQNTKGSQIGVTPAGASGKQSLGEVNTQGLAANPAAEPSPGLSDPPPATTAVAPPTPRAKPLDIARLAREKAAASLAAASVSAAVPSSTVASTNQGGPLSLTPTNNPPAQPTQQVAALPQATPPAPAPQPVQRAQPAPQPAPQQSAPAATGSGAYVVQLASYRDEGSARSGFQDMKNRYPGVLGSYQSFISETKVGSFGTFYRLQVGPVASADAGRQICSSLLAAGEKDCIVKRR